MSAVDIWSCVKELQELVDGRINKIYHSGNEIRIKIHAERRFDLLIEAGKRIHLTRFARETKIPSSFAMLLRKHLEGGRIKKIEQYDFDRIVVIEVQRGDETKFLIAELFLKGNIILADSEMNIIMALKKLRPGLRYQFPEERVNPENILDRLQEILENEEVVKVLATKGGLGGLFAEEICIKSGINKKKNANELGGEEIDKIKESIRSTYSPLFSGKLKPHIVVSDNKYVDVLPFELEYYSDFDKKYFPTLNDALDEFYSKEITTEKKDVSIQKLKKRLEKQLEAKENFEKELKLMKETGDTIYENYQTIEEIMNAFKSARKSMSWDEISKEIAEKKKESGLISLVKSLNPAENTVTISINGKKIVLNLDKSIPQIADEYYEKAKKIKRKLEGLIPAIEETKKAIESEGSIKRYSSSMRIVRKREWFERFRWFITSEGFLVIGGRNARMNSEIVSKYMESNDLFFHTQSPGAPVTVIKRGQEAGEKSIIEAAQFAATYSSLWKESKYSGEVYYVKPEQVKKAAKAGEYLAKGGFYIEGKRNYLSVGLSCAVGVEIENLRVLGGPLSAVKNCDYYVEIEIGDRSHNEIAIEIAAKLTEMAKEEEKHIVKSIATPDEIMKFLPPGKSRIKET